MQTKNCLDRGEVEIIDTLGNDLTVVNAARVSFGKRKDVIDDADIKLIKYLKDNKHYSPFRHIIVQFRIKAPEFCMRQLYKHIVGIEVTSSYPTKDHAWNEISGRYTPVTDFYVPDVWRKQSEDNKQASSGRLKQEDQIKAEGLFDKSMDIIVNTYNKLLALGVAKEQARIILPLNLYTEVYWTASFQAIMNFLELRLDAHAQWEIREYAKVVLEFMEEYFPITTKIWLE
ncbi:MAG TPA: FAD-dependent thymidylate synthase [Bacteroidales bacterium]|nr:FAD-dependent thymidylate synthase [Bacteroidales bacterium]